MSLIVARPRPYVEVTFAAPSITLRDAWSDTARLAGCGPGMELAVEPVTYRLRTPLATSYGEVRERGAFRVTLTAADGTVGTGEAAPLEPYDGVPLELVGRALERYAEVLADDRGRT